MQSSRRLSLPYLQPSQAQKHVTHNEALQKLDILVQMAIESFEATTPPAAPVEGEIHALGAAPTGAWAGHGDTLAAWVEGAWLFLAPQEGWQALDKAGGGLKIRTDTGWEDPTPPDMAYLPGVGVNAAHDTTNRLSVAAPATLLTHEGAGHQLKINKKTGADTASLLFQTGWAGRAEMGTAGGDDFAIKVSVDGSSWTTALSFDAATGRASGMAVTQAADDTAAGRLMRTGDGGILGPALGLTGTADLLDRDLQSGAYVAPANAVGGLPETSAYFHSLSLSKREGGYYTGMSIRNTGNPAAQRVWFGSGGSTGNPVSWTEIWHRANTTVDTNGFVKEASPIIRLFNDGTEEPTEPMGAVFARTGTGRYTLSGVAALASRGWRIEVPQDANGNRVVFVDTDYDAALRMLSIRTHEIVWDGGWVPGAPRDIPAGRWVDLRFSEEEGTAPPA